MLQVEIGKDNMLPDGRLFVQLQRTGADIDRKVSGELLIEAAPVGGAPSRAAPEPAHPAGRGGHGGPGDENKDEDEGEGDHDSDDDGAAVSIDWALLDTLWHGSPDYPDCVTVGTPLISVCDEPVPQPALDRTLERIDAVASTVKDWKQIRRREEEGGPMSITFTSPSTGARLQHCTRARARPDRRVTRLGAPCADFLDASETYIALESKRHNVVCFMACLTAHPVIVTSDFSYDNSDGSSSMGPAAEEPGEIVRNLRRVSYFSQDTSH
jgi:hypothetical protein